MPGGKEVLLQSNNNEFILRGAVVQCPSENRVQVRTVSWRHCLSLKVNYQPYKLTNKCLELATEAGSSCHASQWEWKTVPYGRQRDPGSSGGSLCCIPADDRGCARRCNLVGDGWALNGSTSQSWMLFIPALEATVGSDGDVKWMICMVLNTWHERILDTLEAVDVLFRDSIHNIIAVVQSSAYQQTRNGVSDVLVDERTYMP